VERYLLLAFVLGLSTRKVSRALLPILGEPLSAQTVSRVAKQLDAAVDAYHRRPLQDQYEILILDGVVLKHKTGAGAQKRTVLVALGIRPDGKKEIIDFRQAFSESQYAWEGFLNHLLPPRLKRLIPQTHRHGWGQRAQSCPASGVWANPRTTLLGS